MTRKKRKKNNAETTLERRLIGLFQVNKYLPEDMAPGSLTLTSRSPATSPDAVSTSNATIVPSEKMAR